MYSKELARITVEKKGAMQKISELSSLISLLRRRKLHTIVEIGTAQGGTLYLWCKISQPDALIVSINLPGGPFGGGYKLKDKKKFRRYKRKEQKLYFLRKDSYKQTTKIELLNILKGKKIDLLLIDDDHRYRGVKRDFKLYSPLVKQNGLIVLHDILFHPKIRACKVDKFWNEIKNKFKYKEFIDIGDDRGWGQWGGIGVIYHKD